MHLCKCSLIFFLHHIYTAQTVKLLNVLISTPMAMKLFETSRRCEKAGAPLKAAAARCWPRGRGARSAPVVFVLGLFVPDSSALTHSPQRGQRSLDIPCHSIHPPGVWHCPAGAQPCKALSLVLLQGGFTSTCHLWEQRRGKFHSQHLQKFPSEVIKKKSSSLNVMKAF